MFHGKESLNYGYYYYVISIVNIQSFTVGKKYGLYFIDPDIFIKKKNLKKPLIKAVDDAI